MKNPDRGIRVFATNNERVPNKFDIYIEYAGRREWLMMHRHSGILFPMLKNGITLAELRKISGLNKDRVKYLIRVIDEYLAEEMTA